VPVAARRVDLPVPKEHEVSVLAPPSDLPPIAARLRGVASSPVRKILALTARPGVISFAGGLPAPELFDAAGLREAYAAALTDANAGRSLQYSTTEGDPELRAAIAARLTARGLPTGADDVLVTSGSQQALTLAATVLIEPGDRVLVEEPSYLAALQAFGLAGAEVVPVACDDEGLDPDAVAAAAARHGARLLYTIPTFHNPTGRTLPLERRIALAAVAERHGLWLIEDDPYGELRYRGEPLPSLATLPGASDRTLALSTLSKVAAPGLRIGWVRTPAALRKALVVAKQAADLHSSTIDQAAAARWLATVDLDAHVRVLRSEYGRRRDALLDGLGAALPPGSTHNRPDGGMFVWARLSDGWDSEELLRRALARDVAFVPGFPFFAGEPDRAALRLSFTTHSPAEIAAGLARLGEAWG
jgi:2-aminoadipate transaminase